MNIYQGDLNFLRKNLKSIYKSKGNKYADHLQKLVDKETPKKPIITHPMGEEYYTCSECGTLIEETKTIKNSKFLIDGICYCTKCGSRIDWSELNE